MTRATRRRWWSRVGDCGLVALVVAVGLASSLAGYRALVQQAASQQRELLNAMGQSVVGAFDLQLVRAVEALALGGQMLSDQAPSTHEQFARFGASLMGESTTLSQLEWQPLVPAARLREFEARAQREQPGFRVVDPAPGGAGVVPVQARALHVPVHYSWPPGGAALGVDMAFDPRRMHSKLLARDAGGPVASETFELIRREGDGTAVTGFAVSAPVYRRPRPADVQTRRAELLGFLAGVIEVRSLMREAALRADANELDLMVFDQQAQHRRIYSTTGAQAGGGDGDIALSVDVGGRPWQLVLRPRAGFIGTGPAELPQRTLVAGSLATVLVALAVARSLVIRRRLERTEAVLAKDRNRLRNVLDGTAAGTWEWDVERGRVGIDERWAQMLGRSCEQLAPVTPETWTSLCHAGDLLGAQAALQQHLSGQAERYAAEFRMRHADGHWVWVHSIGRVFERDRAGRPLRMAGTHMDISQRKRDEQRLHDDACALEAANRQLRDLAIVDALTGAFNRRHFNEVCQSALADVQRGQAVALCMLDVDHFKAYNDHHGHQAGDAVLTALAQALKGGLRRSTDALFRLGGEEFGVIFSAASPESARQFVDQLAAALHALALPHAGSPLGIVTASFGVAWWGAPTATLTPQTMYAEADAALYDAKRGGRNQIVMCSFSPDKAAQQSAPAERV